MDGGGTDVCASGYDLFDKNLFLFGGNVGMDPVKLDEFM